MWPTLPGRYRRQATIRRTELREAFVAEQRGAQISTTLHKKRLVDVVSSRRNVLDGLDEVMRRVARLRLARMIVYLQILADLHGMQPKSRPITLARNRLTLWLKSTSVMVVMRQAASRLAAESTSLPAD